MDLPGNLKATRFYARSRPFQGIRLTDDNYKQIADFFGGTYGLDPDCIEEGNCSGKDCLSIKIDTDRGYVNDDWLVQNEEGGFKIFMTHDRVMKQFYTHSERMAEDEKYAKVFTHVIRAMQIQAKATYHSDTTDGMDLVAVEATRKILEDLS